MGRRNIWSLICVLVLVSLLATACAAPLTQSQIEEVASGVVQAAGRYMPRITLPRLVLVYDANGVPRLFGARLTAIGNLVGIDLSALNLQPATLERLAAGNIQHVELEVAEEGLFVYVNGKALPYIAWDEASLDRAGDLIVVTQAIPYAKVVDKAVPLLPRLGIDLVAQFPTPEGVEAIPLRERAVRVLAVPAEVKPSMVLNLVIPYSADGVPNLAGVSTRDLEALTGMNLRFLELSPNTLRTLQSAQIQRIGVAAASDGLHLSINGENVLHLAYNQEHLMNAAEVSRAFLGDTPLTRSLPELVPTLYAADIRVTLELPTGQ